MKRSLLILDYQYDFISGNKLINSAEWKCAQLATNLLSSKGKYESILFGLAEFPYNHKFLIDEIPYCIQHTIGAAIDDNLYKSSLYHTKDVEFFIRGSRTYQSSSSFIRDDFYKGRFTYKTSKYEQIDIVGISESIEYFLLDCIENKLDTQKFCVCTKYCAAKDKESQLIQLLKYLGICFTKD